MGIRGSLTVEVTPTEAHLVFTVLGLFRQMAMPPEDLLDLLSCIDEALMNVLPESEGPEDLNALEKELEQILEYVRRFREGNG